MPRKCPSRVGWQGSSSPASAASLGPQPRAQPIAAVARVAIGRGYAPVPRASSGAGSHWGPAVGAGPWLWDGAPGCLAQEIPWISKWWRLCEVETGWNWQELWGIKIGRSSSSNFTRCSTAGKGGLWLTAYGCFCSQASFAGVPFPDFSYFFPNEKRLRMSSQAENFKLTPRLCEDQARIDEARAGGCGRLEVSQIRAVFDDYVWRPCTFYSA